MDHHEEPTAFRIEVGPFFYLAGNPAGPGGRAMIEAITPYTLFMPSSPGWIEAAKTVYGERLIGFDRYTFSAEDVSAQHLEQLCSRSPFKDDVRRMDVPFAAKVWAQDHFVELSDFDSPEDFVQRGVGFYLERHSTVAGAAYSSLVCSKGIETSIFVAEEHRRQGVATVLACNLLQWCIENNAEANWDAANAASCGLAEKLGYEQTGEYEAYYLPPE